MTQERLAYFVALVALVFALGYAAGLARVQQPSCPTEDSCTIDYRGGAWHIEETIP